MDQRRARADSEISDHSDASSSEDGKDEREPKELHEVSSGGSTVIIAREAAGDKPDPSLDASDTAAAAAIAGLSLMETALLAAGADQSKNGADTPLQVKTEQHTHRQQKQKKQKQKAGDGKTVGSQSGSTVNIEAGMDDEQDVQNGHGLSAEINAQAESMLGR